jgi:hypothetical protein
MQMGDCSVQLHGGGIQLLYYFPNLWLNPVVWVSNCYRVRYAPCIDRSACFADYTFQFFCEKTLVGRLYIGTYAVHAR